jgi:hypothetical protein
MRRSLLAAGLALMWFVQVQQPAVEASAPAWVVAVVLAVRLLTDFVGAWVAVSIAQLAVALGRAGLGQLRASRQRGSD